MENDKRNNKAFGNRFYLALLFTFQVALVVAVLAIFASSAFAGIGQNVTVITRLDVGNVYPEIINITLDSGATGVDLIANNTKNVTIYAVVRDFNGENDLNASTAEFFDNVVSSYGGADDNNNHYTNSSCIINRTYGDAYEASVTCSFDVWYYANNQTWNGTFFINDSFGLSASSSDTITINRLISIGLPDQIDYGLVNATNVSSERVANVTNFGNARINLSLQGYAVNITDGLAMNCSLGAVKNISVGYEKYNLSVSNTSILNLAEFEQRYSNLSNTTSVKTFSLNYRQNDTVNEAINATYWRIYVPIGVAGTCAGNIIFGATQANGS